MDLLSGPPRISACFLDNRKRGKGRLLYLEKKRCKPMPQKRGMQIAKIWPPAGVSIISVAPLIMCLAAGVGGLVSQSTHLQSPHGSGKWNRNFDKAAHILTAGGPGM